MKVAIVDSGVDGSLPELAGRVTAGNDIINGTGRGNTDCLGSGTAMAGIVAARSGSAGGAAGMAPDAMIMPVRVAPTRAAVPAADQASAIAVAVSAGARVIALGGYINPALPAVASAIKLAASHDVVVAAEAPARPHGSAAASGGMASAAGVIRVGAINIDGSMAANYQPGSVDVVAPGVGITSLGITGTGQFEGSGTQYAVAFVAGEAALVRARYPDLTAAQVVRQIEGTADRMDSTTPPDPFGWGLIDPGVAVTRLTAVESRRPGPAAPPRRHGWSSLRIRALAIIALLALIVVFLLALRIRRIVRPAVLDDADSGRAGVGRHSRGRGLPAGRGGLPAPESVPAAVTSARAASARAAPGAPVPAGTGEAWAGPGAGGEAWARPGADDGAWT
jgi:hypothetical protein